MFYGNYDFEFLKMSCLLLQKKVFTSCEKQMIIVK